MIKKIKDNTGILNDLDLHGPVPDTLQQTLPVHEVRPHIVDSGDPALCLITVITSHDLEKKC
jgi:hypothetical protein